MAQERLQKILASAGVASRRKAEELITSGRVEVNGQVVTELGTKADPRQDHIRVDGKLLSGPERPVYIMLHKPKGYVTTVTDPEGRPTVLDLVRGVQERLFPVGRLDFLSEGLLLLTNDGELMQKLTHASSHVPKSYEVKVSGRPTEEAIDKLRTGILLPPEPTRAGTRGGTQPGMKRRSESVRTQPAEIELSKDQDNPWYQITLTEGRNRQIRRMFEQIGHHVEKIKRVRYGTLELDLEPGQWRPLSPKEVGRLRSSIGKPYVIEPPRRRAPRPPSIGEREGVPREGRELSTFEIRGLRDRARAEGEDRPKRPMRVASSGQKRDKASFQPDTRRSEGGRTRFERGRSEQREGRMRGDRDRREAARFDRQRPRNDREGRFEGQRPRFEDRRSSKERPRFEQGGRPRDARVSDTGRPRELNSRPDRPRSDRPRYERTSSGRPSSDRPNRGGKFGKTPRPGSHRPKRNR